MLTQETKRKIDSARNILVGKVPDPKAQVEQITTALIYKFMDDMDKEAQELGGKARFFTNGYEKYAWTKLMDTKLGGQERLNLYVEAISTLGQNPHLPQLFRDIFKNAFLPYRDPETLNLFLKEINGFTYNQGGELGDAFEYLLLILGSQGDAGQFLTPRHIIDFIVASVDPKKDETICDPACGTAGFLISAYKHILKENEGKPLTPDERKTLMDHFVGYDISPDMVRLSKVNLYLHGFPSPTIFEYDTLSNEEKWDESFDVMLANPPFMSPSGGIRPHKRFSVQANRSEVLFVDYILEHLLPNGRAGIIVPEGIIFQSAGAYKTLRKMLVEDGLLAVVSLPAGVFNPYAGVKTSILLFDKELAKKTENILFYKITADGFGLGAQRRGIDANDLPHALEVIKVYKDLLRANQKLSQKDYLHEPLVNIVPKEKIAETGDYNLSGDRYKEIVDFTNQKWPMVSLDEIIDLNFGVRITKKNDEGIEYPVYGGGGESFKTNTFNREDELIVSRFAMSDWCVRFVKEKFYLLDSGFTFSVKPEKKNEVLKDYIDRYFLSMQQRIYSCARGHAQKNLDVKQFRSLKIPFPPIEVQKEIVEKIDGYQKIIDGAKQVVESWKLKIDISSKWEKVRLGDVCNFENGKAHEQFINERGKYIVVNSKFIASDGEIRKYSDKSLCPLLIGDVVMVMSDVPNGGALAKCFFVEKNNAYTLNQRIGLFRPKNPKLLDNSFLYLQLNRNPYLLEYDNHQSQTNLRMNEILDCPFFLPEIEEQKQIVEKIEEEREIIGANKKLVAIMEQKIAGVLSEV